MANRENVQKWVDALRSGEFEQGTGYLNKNDKYCCLGVACEVAVRNGLPLSVSTNSRLRGEAELIEPEDEYKIYGESALFLAPEVSEWLGLDSALGSPDVTYNGDQVQLTWLNDEAAKSFKEIADLIEDQWIKEPVAA